MIELNRIYNEDCMAGMQRIPDHSVDAIICDLPYGTTRNSWDSVLPLKELWKEYWRIVKPNGAIVLFAQIPFSMVLAASQLRYLKYEWIWEKSIATGFLNAKIAPLKTHENILVFYKKPPTYNPQMREGFKPLHRVTRTSGGMCYGKTRPFLYDSDGEHYPVDILKFKKDKQKLHPTQKPVNLLRYLVRTYTNPGETVLDNCMGVGTTALACILEKRNYIGFELNKEYWDISQRRLSEVQLELF